MCYQVGKKNEQIKSPNLGQGFKRSENGLLSKRAFGFIHPCLWDFCLRGWKLTSERKFNRTETKSCLLWIIHKNSSQQFSQRVFLQHKVNPMKTVRREVCEITQSDQDIVSSRATIICFVLLSNLYVTPIYLVTTSHWQKTYNLVKQNKYKSVFGRSLSIIDLKLHEVPFLQHRDKHITTECAVNLHNWKTGTPGGKHYNEM